MNIVEPLRRADLLNAISKLVNERGSHASRLIHHKPRAYAGPP